MKMIKTAEACDQKKRSFLKLSGLLGLGAASTALFSVDKAEAVLFGRNEYKVSRTRTAMGTYVSITAIHSSRDQAEQAIGLAFDEIDRLTALLSRYDAASMVSLLNDNGALEFDSSEVVELVSRSLYYHKQTNGAFDITVKPLVDLYKQRFAAGLKPSEAEITAELAKIGSEYIRIENGRISFTRPEMGITLDGIAKGFIVDRISSLLAQQGITNHLINAGGDIRTNGAAAGNKPWTVAIQDPAKQKQYPAVIKMTNGAIATSGNYEIFYDKERMFHHIVDSHTGHSPLLATSVTVKAASVMDADALATSVFVMEPSEGVSFINRQPYCECFVVRQNGVTMQSKGWKAFG
ncbi:MAG: FAD:protein FMN transferase [Desulfobulbaceae bacterium]|nr:FAD:protein FMN transferase [Desulfobulbaceae bacterium]HIJ77927.1 FAD:protein FMN transferase [Deltaproteobacteria bacterium]